MAKTTIYIVEIQTKSVVKDSPLTLKKIQEQLNEDYNSNKEWSAAQIRRAHC